MNAKKYFVVSVSLSLSVVILCLIAFLQQRFEFEIGGLSVEVFSEDSASKISQDAFEYDFEYDWEEFARVFVKGNGICPAGGKTTVLLFVRCFGYFPLWKGNFGACPFTREAFVDSLSSHLQNRYNLDKPARILCPESISL